MPFSGAGIFSRLFNWMNDSAAGTGILPDRMDQEMDGFAAGLSNAICRDGQSTVAANIPFNGHRITGLGAATAGTDALNRDTGDGRYAMLTGDQTIGGAKTFQASATFSGGLFATGLTVNGAGNIELGRVDGSASTPYLDFHSGAVAVDFDARIIATGGTGSTGGGGLSFYGTSFSFGGAASFSGAVSGASISAPQVYVSGAGGALNVYDRTDNTQGIVYHQGGYWRLWRAGVGDVFRVGVGGDTWTYQLGDLKTYIDVVGASAANARGDRVAKTGDTMSGQLRLAYSQPAIAFEDVGVNGLTAWLTHDGYWRLRNYGASDDRFRVGPGGDIWCSQLGDINGRIEGRAAAYATNAQNGAQAYSDARLEARGAQIADAYAASYANARLSSMRWVDEGFYADAGQNGLAGVPATSAVQGVGILGDAGGNVYGVRVYAKRLDMLIPNNGWVAVST